MPKNYDDHSREDARDEARLMADDGPDDGELPVRRVNSKGWNYIKEWILATQNEDHNFDTGAEAEEAWCSEAEESMGNGNPPMVEMQASATKSGSCETFTVPNDGVYECEPEPGICPACSGSGEGMHEGTTCYQCKGRGEV
jgi:hypothetical protein